VSAPVAPAVTYFEDVVVGSEHETPAMTVTHTHMTLYGGVTGDHSETDGVAPEMFGLCLSTGLGWRIARPPLVVLAFMGIDWKIERPIRVGDTIRSRSRTAVKRSMRDSGVVIEQHELVDQHETVLQHGRFTFLVAKRSPATSS
jgi:acyl dehydratase